MTQLEYWKERCFAAEAAIIRAINIQDRYRKEFKQEHPVGNHMCNTLYEYLNSRTSPPAPEAVGAEEAAAQHADKWSQDIAQNKSYRAGFTTGSRWRGEQGVAFMTLIY